MKAFRAPGLRRGDVRARGPARRARARSSGSTRSSCAAATTPTTSPGDGKPFSGKNLLECYRRAEPHWERRHEVRARSTATVKRGVGHGLADLVRRRRAAELRVDPGRLERPRRGGHGRPGRRHRHEDGAGADRRRGARASRSTQVTDRGRRHRARPLRDALGRLLDDARRWGPRCAPPPPTRGGRSSSSRRSATRPTPTALALDGGAIVLPDGSARAARGDRRACSGTGRSSARAPAGRTRPGMNGAHLRRPGRRGRGRRRDGRGDGRARRRDPRRRARDQPARRLEPDRGRDHPGDRPHALRAAPRSTRRPARILTPHARRLQAADDRRRARRSSASSSTSPTRS